MCLLQWWFQHCFCRVAFALLLAQSTVILHFSHVVLCDRMSCGKLPVFWSHHYFNLCGVLYLLQPPCWARGFQGLSMTRTRASHVSCLPSAWMVLQVSVRPARRKLHNSAVQPKQLHNILCLTAACIVMQG